MTENVMPARLLHIIQTDYVRDGEMLVKFSDGTSAIYETEELEKLRPRRKELFALPELRLPNLQEERRIA
jgi:hypothetical protein